MADAELAAGRSSSALLLLDYVIQHDSGQKQKLLTPARGICPARQPEHPGQPLEGHRLGRRPQREFI
jgi:hypothetical protein